MFSFLFKRLTGFVLLILFGYVAMPHTSDTSAIRAPRKVVQIAGVVMDNDNLHPVPYVNIAVRGTYRGTSADGNGFFTLVTYAGETLVFSSVGFRQVVVKIPDTITSDRYTLYQSLQRDTTDLPLTVIYPWPTKEKFREAFLNLNVPDDDFEIARKNVILSDLRERAKYSRMDAGMNYKHLMQQRHNQLYYAGQQMPNNLLNPFAWAQFLRIWNQQKDEKKRQKAREWDSYEP
ncbi:MAG: carboxypeptidase-like regulatory domain-containing protein [Bacteroidales bacterium]|jgi:hypothetical protein|nr:carboxypeptidase-like regulatory domain-containing protein [Bacteroidales bacterium]